jgi:WD40 repeat protein
MNQPINAICVNPACRSPYDQAGQFCAACGAELVLAQRYRAVRLLGQGSSGRTFLAQAHSLAQAVSQPCVIKQLAAYPLFPEWPGASHPQLPQQLDQFVHADRCYWVQEYIPGPNLATRLASKGRFTAAEIWQLLASLLPAIATIHATGMIHGDIKPENIIDRSPLLAPLPSALTQTSSKSALILPVSATALLGSSQFMLVDRAAIWPGLSQPASGSPVYAAPEQLCGQAEFVSDLYSLGVTCIHLLTGVPPFSLFDFVEQRWAWRHDWPVDEQTTWEKLAELLDRLIASNPCNRINPTAAMTELSAVSPKSTSAMRKLEANSIRKPESNWQCCLTLTGHSGLFAHINAIAISPDGTIASASDDQTIRLWNCQTGQEKCVLRGHDQFVKAIAFHPQKSHILVSGSRDRTVIQWDVLSSTMTHQLTGHTQAVNAVQFSPDGSLLASGSADKTIKLWSAQWELITTLKGHKLAVTALAFSPLQPTEPLRLASASNDGTVRLWNVLTGQLITTLTGHTQAVRAVAFSPDGQYLATAGDDRTIRLWDPRSGQCRWVLPGHSWPVSALAVTPDSAVLISGSWDHTLKLWQLATGQEIDTLVGHTDSVSCVGIWPEQHSTEQIAIVSGSYDRTLKLWHRRRYNGD